MSHELRTPLNAVIGYSELLMLGVSGPVSTAQSDQLERIRGSANHLVGLIDQVLRFARLEAGHDDVRTESIDAVEVAREAAGMLAPIAASKGIAFRVELPATPLRMESDAQKLRQILLNLLSNATNFTTSGDVTLTLETLGVSRDERRERAPLLVFRVRDTGIGIAAQHLEHIFDPFWQASPALTRTVGGTGLGLSVSRQLATLLGGTLTVESSPDAGSTFTLTVPAIVPAERRRRAA